MPVLVLSLADLPAELRSLPRRDGEAITRANRITMEVDAHRWIQWSIMGGGWLGEVDPDFQRRTATEEEKATRGKTKQKRKPVGLGKKLVKKLRDRFFKKAKAKKAKRPKKEPDPPPDPRDHGYRPPIDTGDYKSGWRSEVDPDGNAVFYSAATPALKAGVIEGGRRPAPIPIEPLARWVERKLGLQGEEARRVAWGISRKAARTKREGLNVLGRAHPKIVEALVKNLARELKQQPLAYQRVQSAVQQK